MSPNLAQDFAANFFLPSLAVAHDPAAGTENHDSQAIQDGFQVCGATVNAASRLADSSDMANNLFTVWSVFQINSQYRSRLTWNLLPVPNIAFALEHIGQPSLQIRSRYIHMRSFDTHRITNPSQHIGDRVGHHGRVLPSTNSPSLRLESSRCRPICGNKFGRCQTFGKPPVADHKYGIGSEIGSKTLVSYGTSRFWIYSPSAIILINPVFELSHHSARKGIPRAFSNSRASLSSRAVVTIQISIP